jgi:hypothetical protein
MWPSSNSRRAAARPTMAGRRRSILHGSGAMLLSGKGNGRQRKKPHASTNAPNLKWLAHGRRQRRVGITSYTPSTDRQALCPTCSPCTHYPNKLSSPTRAVVTEVGRAEENRPMEAYGPYLVWAGFLEIQLSLVHTTVCYDKVFRAGAKDLAAQNKKAKEAAIASWAKRWRESP